MSLNSILKSTEWSLMFSDELLNEKYGKIDSCKVEVIAETIGVTLPSVNPKFNSDFWIMNVFRVSFLTCITDNKVQVNVPVNKTQNGIIIDDDLLGSILMIPVK